MVVEEEEEQVEGGGLWCSVSGHCPVLFSSVASNNSTRERGFGKRRALFLKKKN